MAEPRLALDRRAPGHEGRDVAVEGARGDAELLCQPGGRDGPSAAAERLEKVEQAGGAGKAGLLAMRRGGAVEPGVITAR